jgi:hypothetical protein
MFACRKSSEKFFFSKARKEKLLPWMMIIRKEIVSTPLSEK